MVVVGQIGYVLLTVVLTQTLHKPVVVRLVEVLHRFGIRLDVQPTGITPGGSTTATRLLGDSEGDTLVEGSAEKGHLACIAATCDTDMLRIDLRHLRTQLLQSVNQTAQAPSPFAVSAIVFQFRIETVEVVVATSGGLPSETGPKLTVVVHLCLLVDHRGDGALLKDALGQGDAAGADHQGVRCLTHSGIADEGTKFERLFADGDRHLQRVAVHTCFYG